MKKNREKNLETLNRITEEMSDLTAPLDKLSEIIDRLGNVITLAEADKDAELLEVIRSSVIKELGQVEAVYKDIYRVTNIEEIFHIMECRGKKCRNQVLLLKENPVTHVSADTFANIGDYLLVRCLRKTLERKTAGKIGWIDVNVRDEVNEDFFDLCNRTNALIIGGGGLFLKDTNPNEISNWQWSCSAEDIKNIRVPIYVLGIGYNRFRGQEEFAPCFTESVNALVERSAFFGVRNHGSVRAVRNYLREELREKVRFHPCATTVISKLYELPPAEENKKTIAVNWASDRMEMRYQGRHGSVMKTIARVLKTFAPDYTIKCYIHCQADELICPFLEAEGIAYEKVNMNSKTTEEEILKRYTEPALVLAVRGHAQMIPFGCKTPVVSLISHDKLKWFLEDIDHPEWGVEVLDRDFEEKLLAKCRYMLENGEKIRNEIEEAQDKLWNVIQENLKEVIV